MLKSLKLLNLAEKMAMGLRYNSSKSLFLIALRVLIVSLGVLAFLKSLNAQTRDIESVLLEPRAGVQQGFRHWCR